MNNNVSEDRDHPAPINNSFFERQLSFLSGYMENFLENTECIYKKDSRKVAERILIYTSYKFYAQIKKVRPISVLW